MTEAVLQAPYNPSTNGQAERFVQVLKVGLRKNLERKIPTFDNIHFALQQLLLSYRTTVHTSTNESPAEKMFSRNIRTRLDLILPTKPQIHVHVNGNIKTRVFKEGERVQCRNYVGRNKWCAGKVIRRLGKLHYEIALDDGRIWKRHINQVQKIGNDTSNERDELEFDYTTPDNTQTVQREQEEQNLPTVQQEVPEILERHMRNRGPPQRYGKVYVH
ncbi:hypothetical protein KPH14_002645 [Odynerus spinipes]|uniref:Integrase catalytic domain-containing protein n=1 Tax=Odynerus spinipes TaxID=1348599 RepID=A0AAD9RGW7_9HYME|nr:hypothetical protein KPH14_002645 [Odynerus spinipes]